MEIDSRVEPLVREALDAAVKEDEEQLAAALSAFPDADARRKGLELTVAISYVAWPDMHDGNPTAEELRQAAAVLLARMPRDVLAVTDSRPGAMPRSMINLSYAALRSYSVRLSYTPT